MTTSSPDVKECNRAQAREKSSDATGTFSEAGGALDGGPLAFCLSRVCRFHGISVSLSGVLAGLPLENGFLVPSCFARAAARAGMTCRAVRAPLERLNPHLAPIVLILKEGRACVLTSLDLVDRRARLLFPELEEGVTSLDLDELADSYVGYAFYLKPVFRFDERAPSYTKKRPAHWFWSTLSENRAIYRDVIVAAVLTNTFALAMPLFTMNIYNRVIPNRAMETLWVTAIGVFIMICSDYLIQRARSSLVDNAAPGRTPVSPPC